MDNNIPDNILTVTSISKAFNGVHAVSDASISIKRGSISSIIGPNGAGKTTLFNLLSGATQADSGTMNFNGIAIERKLSHQIARLGLIRTFQGAKVIKRLSVLENIVLAGQSNPGDDLSNFFFPKKRQRYENQARIDAEALLETIGLTALAHDYAGILSGGQRKLLDLARAMMAKPTLLLLDEPFAGVNPALVEKLLEILMRLKADRDLTLLLVEHDLETVMNISDHVFVMAQGAVIASGEPASIFDNEVVVDAYLGARRHTA